MTAHRVHTNLFHNQCLALQTIAILHAYSAPDRRAMWIYEHAVRHLIPEWYDGIPEGPIPAARMVYLPKVMLCDGVEAEPACVRHKRFIQTLKGVGT